MCPKTLCKLVQASTKWMSLLVTGPPWADTWYGLRYAWLHTHAAPKGSSLHGCQMMLNLVVLSVPNHSCTGMTFPPGCALFHLSTSICAQYSVTTRCGLQFHCHNAVHEDRDMMLAFSVVPPNLGLRTARGTGFDADIAKLFNNAGTVHHLFRALCST